nr:sensor histidine kinase [uncultured bacterium]
MRDGLCGGADALLIAEEEIAADQHGVLTEFLDRQPSWSDLPVLVLARPGADSAAVAMAMDRLGNVTVLERPTRIASLVSAVRAALRARGRQYQLRSEEERLRKAHDQLEDRVRERTAELRDLNTELKDQIRERVVAEQRARRLLRELVTAQEKERARISRDLHDELGQQMTSLRLRLAEVGRNLVDVEKTRSELEIVERAADKIDSEISFLAWEIRPTNLEKIGLVNALRDYISEWSRNFEIPVEFRPSHDAGDRLLPEIETNLYRITQEALHNIAKYARASQVNVLLMRNNGDLTAIVEDDGVGFDPNAVKPSDGQGGLGLRGMQERAELLGGGLEIESSPGVGTTVFVRIPAYPHPELVS